MTYINGIPDKKDFQIEIGQYYPYLAYLPNLGLIRKKDATMADIYAALDHAKAHRNTIYSTETMKRLRALRRACIEWVSAHYLDYDLTETPKVKELGRNVHYRMEYLITMHTNDFGRKKSPEQKRLQERITSKQTRDQNMVLKGFRTTIGRTVNGDSYFTESFDEERLANVGGDYSSHRNRYPGRHLALKEYKEMIYKEYYEDDPGDALDLHMAKPAGLGVKYCTEAERQPFKLKLGGDGVLRKNDDTLLNTIGMHSSESGSGWGIFVVDMFQNFYVNSHAIGKFHHSSFLAGAPVFSAGEICVFNGVLLGLTNKTGHYRSGPDELFRALKLLEQVRVGPIFGGGVQKGMSHVAVSDPFRAKGCWRSGADAIISDGDFSSLILRGDPEVEKPTQQNMEGIASRIKSLPA